MSLSDRVVIELPEQAPLFVSHYCISFQDINAGQHLSNDKFLVLCEEIYQQYLKSIDENASFSSFWGCVSVIASAKVQFMGQGFYGDDVEMRLWITEYSKSAYRVVVQLKTKTHELGRVQVDRVFFDHETQKTVPCPAGFIEAFESNMK